MKPNYETLQQSIRLRMPKPCRFGIMQRPERGTCQGSIEFGFRTQFPEQACERTILPVVIFVILKTSEFGTVIQLPSVELLESCHAFPCHFTFKVIGSAEGNFTARVVACVRDELGMETDPPFSLRNTEHGRHVAVTLEPMCESSQQVLAIYSRLSGMDGLVMLLGR